MLLDWTIKELKERIFPEDVKAGKSIRLIFQGKMLCDENTLEESGVIAGSFIHCSITEPREVVDDPEDEARNSHGALHRDLEDAQIPPWLLQAHFARQGTNGDFVLGFIMGFFLGVLTLIWVWQRAVPRRQKLGIMLGFGCNLLVSFITHAEHDGIPRDANTSPANSDPPGHGS